MLGGTRLLAGCAGPGWRLQGRRFLADWKAIAGKLPKTYLAKGNNTALKLERRLEIAADGCVVSSDNVKTDVKAAELLDFIVTKRKSSLTAPQLAGIAGLLSDLAVTAPANKVILEGALQASKSTEALVRAQQTKRKAKKVTKTVAQLDERRKVDIDRKEVQRAETEKGKIVVQKDGENMQLFENARLKKIEEEAVVAQKAENERLEKLRIESERIKKLEVEAAAVKEQEQERLKKARIEEERIIEQERLKKARIEEELIAEQERLKKARIEEERIAEQERLKKAKIEEERIAEQERLKKARIEEELIAQQERLKKARIEEERIAEQERLMKLEEKAIAERAETQRLEKLREEKVKRAEQERIIKGEADARAQRAEKERLEKVRVEKEKMEEQKRVKEEEATHQANKEKLEIKRIEDEKAEQKRLAEIKLNEEEAVQKAEKERAHQSNMKILEKEKIEESTKAAEYQERIRAEKEKESAQQQEQFKKFVFAFTISVLAGIYIYRRRRKEIITAETGVYHENDTIQVLPSKALSEDQVSVFEYSNACTPVPLISSEAASQVSPVKDEENHSIALEEVFINEKEHALDSNDIEKDFTVKEDQEYFSNDIPEEDEQKIGDQIIMADKLAAEESMEKSKSIEYEDTSIQSEMTEKSVVVEIPTILKGCEDNPSQEAELFIDDDVKSKAGEEGEDRPAEVAIEEKTKTRVELEKYLLCWAIAAAIKLYYLDL